MCTKQLLITGMLLACSATYAEQARDLNGRMVHVYSGTQDDRAVAYKANAAAARAHAQERKARMERLHSKLAAF